MTKKKYDPEVIKDSQAIRAVNHYIATRLNELRHWEAVILDRMKLIVNKQDYIPGYVTTRVSYEGDEEVKLALNPRALESLASAFDEFNKIYSEIGNLTRYKLRLFNDYDFTHGENTDQKIVFGDKPLTPTKD